MNINITKNIGMLLLAVWLILIGLETLLGFDLGILMSLLAMVAGVFVLLGK
jgi:hypothetical protein